MLMTGKVASSSVADCGSQASRISSQYGCGAVDSCGLALFRDRTNHRPEIVRHRSGAMLLGQPIQIVKYADSPAARGIGVWPMHVATEAVHLVKPE